MQTEYEIGDVAQQKNARVFYIRPSERQHVKGHYWMVGSRYGWGVSGPGMGRKYNLLWPLIRHGYWLWLTEG